LNILDSVLKGYVSPSKTPNAAPVTGMLAILSLQSVFLCTDSIDSVITDIQYKSTVGNTTSKNSPDRGLRSFPDLDPDLR